MSLKSVYIRSLRRSGAYIAGAAAMGLLLLYICTRPHSVMERWHYPDISDLFDAMNHFIMFSAFNFLVLSALLGASAVDRPGTPTPSEAARKAFGRPSRGAKTALPTPRNKARMTAVLLSVGLTWGFVCELLQLFIPTRSFQFIDVGANTLPSLLVFFIFHSKMKK